MAKVKLEDGSEIDVLTPEEAKALVDAGIEEYKKNNPPAEVKAEKTPEEKAAEAAAAEAAANNPVKALTATVEALQKDIRARDLREIARTYAKGDAAKMTQITENFDKLTGYDATPEGLAQQAEAAARMAGIDTTGINVGDIAGTGSGRNVDAPAGGATTTVDAEIQKAMGITPDVAEKYAPQAKAAGFNVEVPKA